MEKLVTESRVKELADVMIEAVDELGRKISITQGGIQGAITPASIAPTAKGMYPVAEPGVYTNFKDNNNQPISITQEDFESGIVFIVYSGTSNAKVITPVPANGEVKEGDMRAVSGEEVFSLIQNDDVTYWLNENNSNLKMFKKYVKNIFIKTNDKSLNQNNVRLTYVGINNPNYTAQKVVIQLSFDNNGSLEPYNFYIPENYSESLENKIQRLIMKEGTTDFVKETEVYVEFSDLKITSDISFIQGIGINSAKLNNLSFYYLDKSKQIEELNNTFSFFSNAANGVNFSNVVEDIFISSNLKDVNKENVTISYIGINDGNRSLLIQLVFKNNAQEGVSYIIKDIDMDTLSNKYFKLPIKDLVTEFSENTDVIVKFKKFDSYPNYSFLNYVGNRFFLSDEAFSYSEKLNSFLSNNSNPNPSKKHTVIKVNPKDGGYNAIQNAIDKITDATENNTYEIIVAQGTYEATNGSQYKGHLEYYPAFICPKDYVSITGVNKRDCIVKASLPWDDLEIDTSVNRNMFQTIYNYAHESTMTRLTIIAENIRYALHQDSGKEAFKKRYYVDCDMIWRGNKGSFKALGIGTFSGSETYFIGGRSICENSSSFAIHNNQAFTQISIWSFTNYEFLTYSGSEVMVIQNSGSLLQDLLEFKGCSFGGAYTFTYRDWWIYTHGLNDHFNHAEWSLKGSGNAPVFFNNTVEGYSLAIKSKSTGEYSKVRFKGGTAYEILIQNSKSNKFGHIGHPERFIVNNDYIAFDGGGDFSGYAIGCVGIREKDYLYGTKLSAEPLGKRLGDCTALNKNLIVEIDGVEVILIFNKNYSLKSNLEVVSEINLELGEIGEAYIANVGADYYLEFTDVNYTVRNYHDNKSIPKGTIVTLREHALDICAEFDKPYGLLIDDLKPYKLNDRGIASGYGRVIKNCYVTTTKGNISSVRTSGIGTNYKIVDGVLVADPNGAIKSHADLILI